MPTNKNKITITPNTVLSIIAPTASGKTALAYQLYDQGGVELISVDSALIYQDMNIGTAKPTDQELLSYPHHLIDILPPTASYNVANFVTDIQQLIVDIQQRGNIPVLVGGTMMYYMALFDGISSIPSTAGAIRDDVEAWRQAEGIADLYGYLQIHDPEIAQRLNVNDTQRVSRAVEVLKQTGTPMSHWQALPKQSLVNNTNHQWQVLSIMPDRPWLHNRIAMRLDNMWADGFVDEVLQLIQKYPLSIQSSAMRCVGYRQVIETLLTEKLLTIENDILTITAGSNIIDTKDGVSYLEIHHKEACQVMKNKALYATRQLAKRQFTWLKKLNNINNFNDTDNNKYRSSIHINTFTNAEQIQDKLIWQ